MAEESLEPGGGGGASPKTSPAGSTSGRASTTEAGTSPDESPNTPSKKNKRKSSEPRRRSDFSAAKRFRPNSVAESLFTEPEQLDTESRDVREFPPDTPETVKSTGSTPDHDERVSVRSSSSTSSTPVPAEIGWFSMPIHNSRAIATMPAVSTTPVSKKGGRTSSKKNHTVADNYHKSQAQQIRTVLTQPPPMVLPTPVRIGAPGLMGAPVPTLPVPRPSPSSTPGFPPPDDDEDDDDDDDSQTFLDPLTGRPTKRSRKNYKNMTRERRVEANARERSRVHTISAAFESLRRAVPSYSYNQKLSKLAILRIACSYIMALSKLADVDICEKANNFSFIDCVDMCTSTIQTEGRARRRH